MSCPTVTRAEWVLAISLLVAVMLGAGLAGFCIRLQRERADLVRANTEMHERINMTDCEPWRAHR